MPVSKIFKKRWGLIYKKGYQFNEEVSGVVTTKVKGQGYVRANNQNVINFFNSNLSYLDYENMYRFDPKAGGYRIFDTVGKS